MNWLIVILGVIVVFLLYQLYVIYTSAPVAATNIYIGKQVSPISASSITNGNNSTYTIGFWIYINTYSTNIYEFIAFGNYGSTNSQLVSDLNQLPNSLNTNYLSSVNTPNNVCTFSMDTQGSPTMYANVTLTNGNNNYIQSIPITTNLPIQTWTYVLVSVSANAGNYADCYINGKLVVSQQLSYQSANLGSVSGLSYKNTFGFSNNGSDIYLNKITWIGNPIDPQTAWYYYNQCNGNPAGIGTMSSYHLEIDLSKDSNKYSWQIF